MNFVQKFKNLIAETNEDSYLVNNDFHISYSRLHLFASKISKELNVLKLTQNEAIGLCFNSKLLQIISTWGVIFSDHPFFPINGQASIDRLNQSFSFCRFVLVDEQEFQKHFKDNKSYEAKKLTLDTNHSLYLIINLMASPTDCGTDAFYLLQTSGSTGTPKIVIHSQDSAWSFVSWATHLLDIKSTDKMISISPLFFDMSILDVFAAAHAGATLFIPSHSILFFPKDFFNYLFQNKIDLIYITPGLLDILLNASFSENLNLRTIILAGENFDQHFLKKLKEKNTNTLIYNFYGPTETNVCTFSNLTLTNNITIGHSCPYANVVLFDHDSNTVSPTSGEIIVSGKTLAMKYLGQNIDNDIITINHIQYYKTGDLGINTDHGIKYVERLDHQIKISGNRISLKEIENTSLRFWNSPKIIAQELDKKLYLLIFEQYPEHKKEEFQLFLKKSLPAYLYPHKIYYLENYNQDEFTPSLKASYKNLLIKLIKRETP